MRGAALSEGGKPIFALPSTTSKGESRIVPFLHRGAGNFRDELDLFFLLFHLFLLIGVVTTRAHVHYVVTEYGVAYLWGKNLRQRADALIAIAHPQHRPRLQDVGVYYVLCVCAR